MTAEVLADDVIAIIHDAKNTTVILTNGKHLLNEISYYSALRVTDENFIRINKSAIVNLLYATRIDKNILYMANDESYEIEKEHQKDVMNLFYRLKLEKFRAN